VMQALDRLAEGRTTFFITHEVVQSASRADLVLWIQDGRVAEAGAPDALMAADGHYARALREARDAGREGRTRALAG
jgi:ABC-type multidrug transport system fused ATPase/permease subunit